MSALEAQRMARQSPQQSKVLPHRSARETKSHRKTKLKAMAQDLMARFTALKSAQVQEVLSRHDADGASVTPGA